MPLARFLFFTCFFIAANLHLAAQGSFYPERYDAQLEKFLVKGQRDSFLHYTNLKLKICREADSLAFWAWVKIEASEFLSEKEGDDNAALKYLEATLAECWRKPRDAGEWEPFCYIQSNMGLYYAQNDAFLQAIAAYEEASRCYEQYRYPDFDALESIYKPLGNCYTRLGDNDKALAVFLKALLASGDNEAMAGLYCNLGIAYWNKGDYEAAEKYHRQGLALPEVSGLKRALLLGALAQTLLDKGQSQQAASNATASLTLLAKEKTSKQATEYRCYSRRTAGIANTRLGSMAEAGRLLSGARADALVAFGKHSRDLGKVDIAQAEWFLIQGDFASAMEAANRALGDVLPGFKPVKPEQNPDASGFGEENVLFEALTAKARAAEQAYQKSGNLSWLTLALDCHDLAWQAESRLRKIMQYSTSKLDLQSSSRAREGMAMHVVRVLYEKTGQKKYLEKAFAIAERSKAALLSDALHENLIRQRLSDSDPRFATLTTLRQSFSLFEKQILLDPENEQADGWRSEADKLVVRINILETEIQQAYPQLVDRNLVSASDVNSELSTGEAMVEYFAGADAIEVFIFQKGKETLWYSIAYSFDLQDLVKRYLAYFENGNAILNDPAGYLNTAFLLWQRLLPAEVSTATRLSIIPDGFLNFIPFDALVTVRPDNGTSLRNAPYLVRRQEVRYAWSASVLRQQKSLRSNAGRYALCLAPGFAKGERGLATLLSTDAERPSNSKLLLSESADLQHFMAAAGQYRVLHLSTHAFASVQGGQLPRLELFDQSLYLPSIYALPLQADLVTLSACQTGLGKEQSGEGVMSLARAFAQAGAACVVSSLWSVNDHSTSQMLSGFYRNLEAGNTIGQALRSAKLRYLDDPEIRAAMQSPYFWAGLTMVGDDRVVASGRVGWWIWIGLSVLAGIGVWVLRKRKEKGH